MHRRFYLVIGSMATTTVYAHSADWGIRVRSPSSWGPTLARWDAVHDDDWSGDSLLYNTATTTFPWCTNSNSWTRIYIRRSFFAFDTSSIDDTDTIDSAVFSLYWGSSTLDDFSWDAEDYITVVEWQQASDTALVVGDFDNCWDSIDNPTEGIDSWGRIVVGSRNTSWYNDFTLNSTGEWRIDLAWYSLLGVREWHDTEDAYPSFAWGSDEGTRVQHYTSEATWTSQDPKLVITHSAAAAATDNSIFFWWGF